MDIDRLGFDPGTKEFYTKEFMDVLESHLAYLKNRSDTYTVQIDTKRAVVYEGDFYGYLNEIKIEPQYHWVIMRLNDMHASTEFNSAMTELHVPNKAEINAIFMAHKATGLISL